MIENLIKLDFLLLLISEDLNLNEVESLELSEAIFCEISKYNKK